VAVPGAYVMHMINKFLLRADPRRRIGLFMECLIYSIYDTPSPIFRWAKQALAAIHSMAQSSQAIAGRF
jgi:hypothetical protein